MAPHLRHPAAFVAVLSLLLGFAPVPSLAEDSPGCRSGPGPAQPASSLVQSPRLDPASRAPAEGSSPLRAKLTSSADLGRFRGERLALSGVYASAQPSSSSGSWWSRRTRAQKVGIVVGIVVGAAVVVAAVSGGGGGGGGGY